MGVVTLAAPAVNREEGPPLWWMTGDHGAASAQLLTSFRAAEGLVGSAGGAMRGGGGGGCVGLMRKGVGGEGGGMVTGGGAWGDEGRVGVVWLDEVRWRGALTGWSLEEMREGVGVLRGGGGGGWIAGALTCAPS